MDESSRRRMCARMAGALRSRRAAVGALVLLIVAVLAVMFTVDYRLDEPPPDAGVYVRGGRVYPPCLVPLAEARSFEMITYGEAMSRGYSRAPGANLAVRGERLWGHILFIVILREELILYWECDGSSVVRPR